MGTRGLIGFIIRAKRHGIFNNSDSYPDCLGQCIVSFILNLKPEDYATMSRLLGEITWYENHEIPKFGGSSGLHEILASGTTKLPESIELLKDDLLCEWAYFMDFENKKLETWRSGELLEEISFEKLREEGEAYMERLENANEEEEEEAVPLEEQKDVKK